MKMCRSQADGGRRCTGSRAGTPPADGKVRIEVHTNKRSYSVVGGESKVVWMPGEKVVSMDVIDPGQGGDTRPSRRVDRKPETEADKRFFDLRESGYTGPVDQDGNATNEHADIFDALRATS
jgi:hypothetical protein